MNARTACLYERLGCLLFLVGLCFIGVGVEARAGVQPVTAAGANVDESKVQNTYHVDVASAEAANDDKHGTADAPFATISYACEAALRDKDRRIGAKVIIAPGVYREMVDIRAPAGGVADTDAPLVIESAEREQAVIDGADTEGWTASTWKVEGPNWTHPWPFRRSAAQQAAWARALHTSGAPPSASGEAYQPGDLLLVDGNLLRQVNRQEELAPGCFWERVAVAASKTAKPMADGADPQEGATVLVQPPVEASLASSILQASTRDHGMAIHGRRNVVVRGLLVQHTAGPNAAGLLLDGCSNVLVDDVLSQWNDGTGLIIAGRASAPWSADFTLRQSHLLHNGSSGLHVTNVKNLLVEDTETCFNNFRGEWANWLDANGPAGAKTTGVHGATWRRLRSVSNFCRGVWWVGDNADVTLEDGAIRGNLSGGLFIENNPGPVLVRRCLVAETKAHPGVREEVAWPAGIAIAGTPDVTLESNIVAGNAVTQLGAWEATGRTEDTPFENRTAKRVPHAERHAYHRNVFYGADATQMLYRMPAVAGATPFYNTLDASENCFWNPAQTEVFALHGGSTKPSSSGPANAQTRGNLESWRTLLRARNSAKSADGGGDKAAEVGSGWQDPLFVDPSEGDFRLRERSPVADWNLPADEGSPSP